MTQFSDRHFKRQRRTATTVLTGDFDLRPTRDVLTSLLNGIGPYKAVEDSRETKRLKTWEKRAHHKQKKRQKRKADVEQATSGMTQLTTAINQPCLQTSSTSPFWHLRPTIQLSTYQRSMSITPPPTPLSPEDTPQPSISSSTSRTSPRRPRMPCSHEHRIGHDELESSSFLQLQRKPAPRKRREPAKKGWKGWVEGSPPPSDKLINLDSAPILCERRTRSGKG